MSTKNSAALAALAISLVPALSQAANRATEAAQACAQAFVATLATPTKVAPTLSATHFYGIDTMLGEPSELELTAVNPRTKLTVARATCQLSARGDVLSIKAIPKARS